MGKTDLVKYVYKYKQWGKSALVSWQPIGGEPNLIWEGFAEEETFD